IVEPPGPRKPSARHAQRPRKSACLASLARQPPCPEESIMSVTVTELVAEAREHVDNLDPVQLARELADGALVVDIREADERDTVGAIPGTVHVPRGLLEFKADPSHAMHLDVLDPDRRTVLYCASGGRSALAARSLQ